MFFALPGGLWCVRGQSRCLASCQLFGRFCPSLSQRQAALPRRWRFSRHRARRGWWGISGSAIRNQSESSGRFFIDSFKPHAIVISGMTNPTDSLMLWFQKISRISAILQQSTAVCGILSCVPLKCWASKLTYAYIKSKCPFLAFAQGQFSVDTEAMNHPVYIRWQGLLVVQWDAS